MTSIELTSEVVQISLEGTDRKFDLDVVETQLWLDDNLPKSPEAYNDFILRFREYVMQRTGVELQFGRLHALVIAIPVAFQDFKKKQVALLTSAFGITSTPSSSPPASNGFSTSISPDSEQSTSLSSESPVNP